MTKTCEVKLFTRALVTYSSFRFEMSDLCHFKKLCTQSFPERLFLNLLLIPALSRNALITFEISPISKGHPMLSKYCMPCTKYRPL